MNLACPQPITGKAKLELQLLMPRLLELMREILASIHEERLIIENDQISCLNELLERRQHLLDTFETSLQQFLALVSTVSSLKRADHSFLEYLEWVEENILPEDLDLHLLVEQLICISKEMTGETNSLVHLLEHKSAAAHSRGLVLKKPIASLARMAVAVADDEHTDD